MGVKKFLYFIFTYENGFNSISFKLIACKRFDIFKKKKETRGEIFTKYSLSFIWTKSTNYFGAFY